MATNATVTFNTVNANLTGNVTGNADTASELETARTISLSGDVSGSVSFDGSQNVDITTTIQPNSVALGSDTTGDYVQNLVAGTGITITNNSGEGATPTIEVTSNTYQPLDAELTAIAGLTSAADKLPYFTGSGTASTADITSAARSILDDSSTSDIRTTLGVGTTDSPSFAGVTADNIQIGITGANEIDTSSGNLTIDSAGGTTTVDDDLVVSGNLTVNGTTTTLNIETLAVEDNIITLNSNVSSSPSTNAGIEVERGTSDNVLVRWNETNDKWELTNDGTTYGNIVTTADNGTVTSTMLANGTVVNEDISSSAAIALSKLASGSSGQIVLANSSGVPTYTTISGDVTISDTGVVSISENSVVLGTDTTGDYVKSLVAGTGISVTSNSGEGATPNIALNASLNDLTDVELSTPSNNNVLKYNSSTSNWENSSSLNLSSLTVSNLTVTGAETIVSATNLSITDSLIYLSAEQFDTDAVDIGIFGAYGDANPGHYHTGLVRDATDGKWKLFSGSGDPTNNVINFASATYDTLKIGNLEASTITSGTWNGSIVSGQYGGTGVANTGKTITLGGNLVTSGSYDLTLTQTGTTNVTLPTTGTLATLSGAESLTNKKLGSLTTNGIVTTSDGDGTLSITSTTGTGSVVLANSAALTGTPVAPTAAADTNTTQIATTQFVVTQAGTTTPSYISSGQYATVGTSLKYARADHTHGHDGLGLTSGSLAQFAATTSAQLAGVISDETGSGALVFGTSPSITTSLTTASTTFSLINANATTVNFAGAATTLSIGAATGTTTINNGLVVAGNLTVNGTSTITLGGNLTTSGAFALTLTQTGTTNVTLPTTGTLATLAGTETFTNKTLTSPTINTPTFTLATASSTTDARMSWDATNKKIQVGNGTAVIDFASGTLVTNAQTASYTLVLTDKDKLVEVSNASANTVTIPLNSSVAFPIGTQITVLQTGTGQTTIAGAAGVTVNATPGLKLRAQWSSVTLIKRNTDTWVALGDLQA